MVTLSTPSRGPQGVDLDFRQHILTLLFEPVPEMPLFFGGKFNKTCNGLKFNQITLWLFSMLLLDHNFKEEEKVEPKIYHL